MLICALSLFQRQGYVQALKDILNKEVERHCTAYPDDTDYLLECIGISSMVYVAR